MEEEVTIKYESGNEDDEIEKICLLWKENLQKYTNDRKLEQHAESLISDISKYLFDFSSDQQKYSDYGRKFIDIIVKSDARFYDTVNVVDVYWIHKQLHSNLMLDDEIGSYGNFFYNALILDTSTESAVDDVKIVDAGLIGDDLTREYLAARYVMSHLSDRNIAWNLILNEMCFGNVRCFMDAFLKHGDFCGDDGFVEISNGNLHLCIAEKQIFLVDFLIENFLNHLNEKRLRDILNSKDANDSNIFHLACQKRIKFLIEKLWILIQKAYSTDTSAMIDFLLQNNKNDKNAFMLAFEMPVTFTKSDFANETKDRNRVLNYYKNPGLLEVELYNFESCLNLVFDIARKNLHDNIKKSLIIKANPKRFYSYETYVYSRDFQGFRYDFLQLRFHCLVRLGRVNASNVESVEKIYHFFSNYIDQFMDTNCNDDDAIIAHYKKVLGDAFLKNFFKVFVRNNFSKTLTKINKIENFKEFIGMIRSSCIQPKDYGQLISKTDNKRNVLQLVIMSECFEMFNIFWESIADLDKEIILKLIVKKNIDRINSIIMIVQLKQLHMLQMIFNFLSQNFNEDKIMDILTFNGNKNYKLMTTAVHHYDPAVFDCLTNFLQYHLSINNQKTLIAKNVLSAAAIKWKENLLIKVLSYIESIFDENEIIELVFDKSWEGQTAFHVASRNQNLTQLQMLCKFARYYLNRDDFLEIITAKDNNAFSIIKNDQTPYEIIYTELPKVSNFYTTYPVFEWIPMIDQKIPLNAYKAGSDLHDNELFIGKAYDNDEFSIIGLSSENLNKFSDSCVDVLAGNGLSWIRKSSNDHNTNFSPIQIENNQQFYIAKISNEIKLMDISSNEECDILCTDETKLREIDPQSSGYIFTRIY